MDVSDVYCNVVLLVLSIYFFTAQQVMSHPSVFAGQKVQKELPYTTIL